MNKTAKDSGDYGWLVPARGPEEKCLEDCFTKMVCALCDLEDGAVRPRYQIKPSNAPAFNVNWCAFAILEEGAPGGSVWHGEGGSRLMADSEFSVLFSFYGPGCRGNARALRDGLWIEQNRAILRMERNIALIRAGHLIPVPELVNERWLKRCDFTVDFVRGPEIKKRGQDAAPEGDVAIKDLKSAAACGLCGRSR